MRAVLIRTSDSRVLTAIELPAGWTGAVGQWQPPAGTSVTISDTIQPTVDPPTTEQVNETTIRDLAGAALAANTTFLAITGTLTNAQRDTQIRALTRQSNGLIRLILGRFEGTS